MARNYKRYYLKDDEYYIICRECGEDKHSDNYHNSPTGPIGKVYVCKPCYADYVKKNKSLDEYSIEYQENTREVLTILGYDLDGDVHQQFKDRIEKKYGIILK